MHVHLRGGRPQAGLACLDGGASRYAFGQKIGELMTICRGRGMVRATQAPIAELYQTVACPSHVAGATRTARKAELSAGRPFAFVIEAFADKREADAWLAGNVPFFAEASGVGLALQTFAGRVLLACLVAAGRDMM